MTKKLVPLSSYPSVEANTCWFNACCSEFDQTVTIRAYNQIGLFAKVV